MSEPGKSVGVFTTDRSLVVQSWDPWLADVTGLSESTVCGRALGDVFPDLEERGLLARARHVAEGNGVEVLAPAFHRYFISCPPRDPSSSFDRMRQHVTISPLRTAEGIVGVVVTIEDVTARLDHERELARELESQDEAIRLRATQSLAGTAEPPSVLANALADESWRVRRAAAEGMARSSGPEAVATLIEAVRERHRDPAVLNAALTALTRSSADVVLAIIALLDIADADVRIYAALALGQLEDRRAVGPLAKRLHDDDVNVRYHAIEALGRIRERSVAGEIAEIAQTRDFYLAFVALDALASIGEPSVAPRLIPLLDDMALQPAVAGCLGALGREDAVAPLAEMLDRPGVPVATLARALASIQSRLQTTHGEGDLVADLARSTITPIGARALVAALAQASDEELPGLVTVLGWLPFDGIDQALARMLAHHGVRDLAAEALSRRGAGAVDVLVDAARGGDDAVRKAAAMGLGRIGSGRAVPILVELLDDASDVAIAAAGALGSIGDGRAFEPLLNLFDHPDATVRQAAVSALNSIGHRDMPAAIERRLADDSPRVREAAARVAGYFGYSSCLTPLLALCDDDVETVRRAAVENLVHFDDPRVVSTVRSALRDPNANVRAAAARALGLLPGPEARSALLDACRDESMWVRYYAARALGRRGESDPEVTETLVARASADETPPVRIAAIEALGELQADDALPTLLPLARESDPEVARAAFATLGQFDGDTVTETLLDGLAVEDSSQRMAVLEALGRQQAARAVDQVASVARLAGDLAVRRQAVDALARIGTRAAVGELVELATDLHLRDVVTTALARLDGTQAQWLDAGLAHSDVGVRCIVIEAAARMHHRTGARLLATALNDPSAAVRLAAARALARLDLRDAERQLTVLARSDESPAVRDAALVALSRR